MTAAELVALCRAHPKTCEALNIRIDADLIDSPFMPWSFGFSSVMNQFPVWLTGALVEKCDWLGIEVIRYSDGFGTVERQNVVATTGDIGHRMVIGKKHPTRLHALFAALEQHAMETTQ